MDTRETIATNILARRTQLRLYRTDLASAVGVSSRTIERYESGEGELPVGRLDAIAAALHCSAVDLANPEWAMEPPHPTFGEAST